MRIPRLIRHTSGTPRLGFTLAALLILLLASCGREVRDWSEVRRRARATPLLIEATDPALAELARRSTSEWEYGGRVIAARFDEPLGTEWRERLQAQGGEANTWTLAGSEFGADGDLLIACFEDPEHAGLPVTLYLGGGSEVLSAWLAELQPLSRRPSLRLVVGRETLITAPLRRDGSVVERKINAVGRQKTDLRRRMFRHALSGELAELPALHGLRIARGPGLAADRANRYLARCAQALQRARDWCAADSTPMHIDLVARTDDFATLGGRDDLGVIDPTGHFAAALLVPGLESDAGAALAEGVARQVWGPPANAQLGRAFGIAATGQCWGKALEEWQAESTRGSNPLVMSTILAREFHALAEARDLAGVRQLWTVGIWQQTAQAPPHPPAKRPRATDTTDELRGVVFELAPVPLTNSAALLREVELAVQFGANGLSLSCAIATPGTLAETIGDRPIVAGSLCQGDALLVGFLAEARARGLTHQTLRPHLLEWNSSDDAARTHRVTLAAWNDFFVPYCQAIEHAALIAELAGVDLLCLGEGASTATNLEGGAGVSIPPDVLQLKREGWLAVTAAARSRFGGDLTYLAEWPAQARRLELWDDLDVVTLSWLPALERDPGRGADAAELARLLYGQLNQMDRLAGDHGKPLLILKLGVPASEGAARDASLARGPSDPQEQARLYRGLADAIERASRKLPAFRGVALTGWGDGQAAGERADDPRGRPAHAYMRRILGGGRGTQ